MTIIVEMAPRLPIPKDGIVTTKGVKLGYSLLERRIERLKAKEVRECIERNPEVWKWIRWALYVRDRILRG